MPAFAFRRLTTQVLFFLTIALLPLGVVGVLQNERLVNEAKLRTELSLLARTEQALSGERQMIQQAFGAADALGHIGQSPPAEIEMCRREMRDYIANHDEYVFGGFIDLDGRVRCSSADRELDFSESATLARLMADPTPYVDVNLAAPGSGRSVLIVNQPRYAGSEFIGYTSLSLVLRDVGLSDDFLGEADPVSLVTFNVDGDVLSTEEGRLSALSNLPADISLKTLVTDEARTFSAMSETGVELVYSVVPIKPGVIYALGSWATDSVELGASTSTYSSVLPILMWLLSLGVVWLVIDRLVIRGIKGLNRKMLAFADQRSFGPPLSAGLSSIEMDQLDRNFRTMAETIVSDEAHLENRLREKNILLKEVHHRVKNNLQIVSSIINIQMRKARAGETRSALKQVQQRIIGLSGVHRTLYQAENLNHVDAAALISQIVEQTKALGLRPGENHTIETDLDEVRLFPDQAIPLSMWVAETLTNALKHGSESESTIRVGLTVDEDKNAVIRVSNDVDEAEDPVDGSGVGSQLIRAFALHLDAEAETKTENGRYEVSLSFKVSDFQQDPQDY